VPDQELQVRLTLPWPGGGCGLRRPTSQKRVRGNPRIAGSLVSPVAWSRMGIDTGLAEARPGPEAGGVLLLEPPGSLVLPDAPEVSCHQLPHVQLRHLFAEAGVLRAHSGRFWLQFPTGEVPSPADAPVRALFQTMSDGSGGAGQGAADVEAASSGLDDYFTRSRLSSSLLGGGRPRAAAGDQAGSLGFDEVHRQIRDMAARFRNGGEAPGVSPSERRAHKRPRRSRTRREGSTGEASASDTGELALAGPPNPDKPWESLSGGELGRSLFQSGPEVELGVVTASQESPPQGSLRHALASLSGPTEAAGGPGSPSRAEAGRAGQFGRPATNPVLLTSPGPVGDLAGRGWAAGRLPDVRNEEARQATPGMTSDLLERHLPTQKRRGPARELPRPVELLSDSMLASAGLRGQRLAGPATRQAVERMPPRTKELPAGATRYLRESLFDGHAPTDAIALPRDTAQHVDEIVATTSTAGFGSAEPHPVAAAGELSLEGLTAPDGELCDIVQQGEPPQPQRPAKPEFAMPTGVPRGRSLAGSGHDRLAALLGRDFPSKPDDPQREAYEIAVRLERGPATSGRDRATLQEPTAELDLLERGDPLFGLRGPDDAAFPGALEAILQALEGDSGEEKHAANIQKPPLPKDHESDHVLDCSEPSESPSPAHGDSRPGPVRAPSCSSILKLTEGVVRYFDRGSFTSSCSCQQRLGANHTESLPPHPNAGSWEAWNPSGRYSPPAPIRSRSLVDPRSIVSGKQRTIGW